VTGRPPKVGDEGQRGLVIDSDGCRLVGRLFAGSSDSRRPTVVLAHGIPGIDQPYDIALALRKAGFTAVIVHYRGCWGSEGVFSIPGMHDSIKATVDDMSSGRYPEVDPDRLAIVGHSFGSWAALLAALDDERLRAAAGYGVVPSTKPYADSAQALEQGCVPWLHGITVDEYIEQYSSIDDSVSPLERIGELAPRPLLLLHGRRDGGVPVTDVTELYRRAGEPKTLLVHDEADHDFVWQRGWLADRLVEWLSGVL
jgi:dienelactone hydrolase